MTEFVSIQGTVPYGPMRELQAAWVERRNKGEVPDTVFFLEHAPVVTRGSGLQHGSPATQVLPWSRESLAPGWEFFEVERGGDLTLHEPGQLVMYPIVKLEDHDVGSFIRKFEQVFIDVLVGFGLPAQRRKNATGVWVGQDPKQLQKMVSLGLAVRHWITFHGAALNWVNDLRSFQSISPCGFSPEIMTRLGDRWTRPEVEQALMRAWGAVFGEREVTRRDSVFSNLNR